MLSERERRTLASIERALVQSDPQLARMFARAHRRRFTPSVPAFLLVVGMALMVLGGLIITVSVAMTGLAFALVALMLAYYRPYRRGFTSPA